MQQAKLSASVVVYNGADEAAQAAASVLVCAKDLCGQLFLIDNASPDGSGARLANLPLGEGVQVLQLPQNVGFGSGHNAVLPLLRSQYHAVVNPDITVDSDVLQTLCAYLDSHPDVVMVTPQLKFPDGTLQYTAKRRPNLLALLARQLHVLPRIERHYLMLDEDLAQEQEIDFCTGCFFVIRTEVYQKIGGFDESYFMYVEDADITRKAQAEGKVMFVPQAYVYHAWHRDANKKVKHFWMQIRSMLHYWRKWGFELTN